MVFSSTTFLFLFLPAVWLLYSLIPDRGGRFLIFKNLILAAASTVFYAFGEPVYILIMLASVTFNYFLARLISKAERSKGTLMVLCVAANLAVLGAFKYLPWLVRLFNSAFSASLPVPALTIPVGISFYTFQILSYVIDVYRSKTPAQKNYLTLYLYISFFPQLIAGPIVKYGDIADQIADRRCSVEKTASGLRRFIFGLGKKVIIANTAAVIADAAFASPSPSSLLAWSGAVCYCIQLYFDFSGYSDMAVGLASIFGFSVGENFNYPYAAFSIRDFWKRWHISLTSWFREYVYFPLGGNRKGNVRTVLNRLIVFFLTGLWHGANFTFILWGMWHGLLMMLEQLTGFDRLTAHRAARPFTRVYTLLAVCLGFVVFRAPDLPSAFVYVGRMFSFSGSPADALLHFSPYAVTVLLAALVLSCPVIPKLRAAAERTPAGKTAYSAAAYILSVPILLICIGSLASSSFNPFIYYIF